MKSHSGEQVNSLGSCFPVKGMSYERMLYAVRCLKSNEDMILALAGEYNRDHKNAHVDPHVHMSIQPEGALNSLDHCTSLKIDFRCSYLLPFLQLVENNISWVSRRDQNDNGFLDTFGVFVLPITFL